MLELKEKLLKQTKFIFEVTNEVSVGSDGSSASPMQMTNNMPFWLMYSLLLSC